MSDHSFDWCDLSQSWPQGQVSRVVSINDSINSQSCGEADYKWTALALAVNISVCFIPLVWPIYCVIKANWSCRFICFESASGVKSSGLFFSSSSSSFFLNHPMSQRYVSSCLQLDPNVCKLKQRPTMRFAVFRHAGHARSSWVWSPVLSTAYSCGSDRSHTRLRQWEQQRQGCLSKT